MSTELQKAIDQIQIVDMENGITENNKRYFAFSKEPPQCMRSKNAPLQISLMVGCFISSFFVENNSIYYIFMLSATFFVCLWYLFDARFIHNYKKAAKAYMFGRNENTLKYLTKILNSKRIYIDGMPLAYNLLKAKEMLSKCDFKAADYLADNALKQIADCPEALQIKGICRNEKINNSKV